MAAGFVRTLFLGSMAVMLVLHRPLAFVARDSVMGRILRKIVPPV
jgi:hypothetical protein